MTITMSAAYAVGYGKPPVHTRFRKGQSGNPSGKPGPAKLAKQRFQRELYAALDGSEAELEFSRPDNLLAGVVKRIALDAVSGRVPTVRLLLSLLDKECKQEARDAAEAEAGDAQEVSLLQGISQGNPEQCPEDILLPDDGERTTGGDRQREVVKQTPAGAPARNETAQISLRQGKTQGNEKIFAQEKRVIPEWKGMPFAAQARTDKRSQLMMSAGGVPR